MEIRELLENRKTSRAKNARQELIERVVLWMEFARYAGLLKNIPSSKVEEMMQYAKKEGEHPKSFFMYLIKEENKKLNNDK